MERVALKIIEKIEQFLLKSIDAIISLAFAAILVTTILQVVLRYGFNSSVLGGGELMEGLFIYTTAIGAAAAVRRRRHINISSFVECLPVGPRKVADVLVHLLVAFLNGVMIYYSVAWIGKVGSNESPVLRLPEWIMQISVPVGCALVIFYCLVNVLLTLRGQWPPKEKQAC